ncbi:DUF6366 family protein [Aquibacillus rhizosphaerae]|uniref:DUF6366 family protein n=1 Tax=Aquibacillus rhizosphaerae TaxID=3051431 RepID=A0ABT7L4R4_9BACI|nr:DUF6366 family protein [Aquibacillus sp. LR5S19]MDL4840857.1 DUF6366 family protein [Aquibacillus sp. LR5S19]
MSETPEQRRERLRLEEKKGNPIGNLSDATNSASSGSLVELVNGLGWKGTGILILVAIVGFILFSVFIR